MSKHVMEKMLAAELLSLNKAIDRKIMLGLSYTREARDHKLVLAKLIRLKRTNQTTSFGRFTFASGLLK